MAGQTYNIDLQATDSTGSMKQRTKDAKEHNHELTKTQQLLKQQSEPRSRGASAEYGIMRATGAGTGAAGRDFAKESQGLSGLVRLYAIYAANIFAAEAAFRALSNAADTSNMIKGLDQLGAYSGVALGQLAKNLAKVSDGALSMRESMEAVAQASTAGLNPKQIMDLGTIAKTTSQALGRDMSDSLSRLTRGVVKLEPELLDELGLFTKIGPATEKYALSIGKTAGQLTDFEKRQAFANAVIKEGLDKFSKLQIDVNPYQKLLGTLKDLSFSALEFLNTGLKPLVTILASNPNALSAILAGIAMMMVKQAIPAVGQYRKSLQDLTIESAKQAQMRVQNTRDSLAKEVADRRQAADNIAQAAHDQFEKTSNKLEASRVALGKKFGSSSMTGLDIATKPIHDITDADLAKLDKLGNKQSNVNHLYKELAANVRTYRDEEAKYNSVVSDGEKALNAKTRWWQTAGQLEIDTQNKLQKSRNQDIVSQASLTGSTRGLSVAFKELWGEVVKGRSGDTTRVFDELNEKGDKTGNTITATVKKMSLFSAAGNLLKGSFMAVTGAIGTALAVAAPWLEIIGLIAVAIGILDGFMDKTKATVKEFTASQDSLTAASKNYIDTVDMLYKKDPSQFFSTQSIDAQAKSLGNLNDQFKDFVSKYDAAEKAVSQSWWARRKDNFFSWFGMGIKDSFTDTLEQNLNNAIQAVNKGTMDKGLIVDLGKILNVEDPLNNLDKLQKSFKGLDRSNPAIKLLADALDKAADKSKKAAGYQTDFAASLTKSTTSAQEFMKQYTVNDPLTKMLLDQSDAATKFSQALAKGTIEENLGSMVDFANSLNENPLFGQIQIDNVRKFRTEVNELSSDYASNQIAVQNLKAQRDKLLQDNTNLGIPDFRAKQVAGNVGSAAMGKMGPVEKDYANNLIQIQTINTDIGDITSKLADQQLKAVKLANTLQQGMPGAMKDISVNLASRIGAELAKGSTSFLQGVYSKLDIVPELAKKAYDLKIREIDTQIGIIKSNRDLIIAMQKSPLQSKAFEAEQQVKQLQLKRQATAENSIEQQTIDEQIRFYTDVKTSAERAVKLIDEAKRSPQEATNKSGIGMDAGGILPQDAAYVQNAAQASTGVLLQLQQKYQERQTNLNDKQLNDINLIAKQEQESANRKLQNLNLDEQALESKADSGKLSNLEYEKEKGMLVILRAQAESDLAMVDINRERNIYLAEAVVLREKGELIEAKTLENKTLEIYGEKQALDLKSQKQKVTSYTNTTENKALIDKFNKTQAQGQLDLDIANSKHSSTVELIGYDKEILSNKVAQGQLSKDSYELSVRAKDLKLIELDYENKIKNIQDKKKLDIAAAEERARTNKTITADTLKSEIDAINQKADAETSAALKTKVGREAVQKSLSDLNEKGEGYLNIFNGFVNSFTDGLIEFAKTGKMSFGDMVNSMIADIVRLELRMMMMRQLEMGGGLVKMILGSIPGTSLSAGANSAALTSGTSSQFANMNVSGSNFMNAYNAIGKNALGNVYDQGLTKFAMGGIVNSPTLFKFAKGAGLMGEAGPEAIMPLKRSADGSLGVRGGSSDPVNVVVNNYGSEKATTKQTLDSRGRPQIEVTIGGMAAGQLAKPGSDMQQTMQNTYGQQPVLPRR